MLLFYIIKNVLCHLYNYRKLWLLLSCDSFCRVNYCRHPIWFILPIIASSMIISRIFSSYMFASCNQWTLERRHLRTIHSFSHLLDHCLYKTFLKLNIYEFTHEFHISANLHLILIYYTCIELVQRHEYAWSICRME